ncbi:MAG: pyridoxal-phosphate dependent enzyme, partial [Gemmatimonadetes bacterium]|nr:pyridoxal-phosphate dependent enzyme [Gemmatimonadota bacterium]
MVAASAGNHAQALARHAARLGIPCTIVMPDTAPLIKVTNTRATGATVIQSGETLSDGMALVERLIAEQGLTLVHAFDDLAVMAGQ